jgi:glycosyltransferase involved in cell wall biosynthesis
LKKKSICFVATLGHTLDAFLVKQSEYLIADGWEVHWACGSKPINKPDGVICHQLILNRSPSFFTALRSFLILFKLFLINRFDVIQYCTPMASLIASITGYITRIPIRIYAQWGLRYVSLSGTQRIILKSAEKTTCLLSTVVQPDSFGNLDFSINEGLYCKKKASVIGNGSAIGIDIKYFDIAQVKHYAAKSYKRLCINKKSFVFGYVGSVREDKGCNELIKSFQLAFSEGRSNEILLMIGDHDFAAELDQQVLDALRFDKRIICVGPIKDIRPFLAITDCFVFPSYREGFGMSIIEAASLGVPAIVSDIPGPNEAIQNYKTGILVPVRDVDSLLNALKYVRENPKDLKKMGKEAIKHVLNKYDSHNLMKAFIENKNKLLKK